MSKQPCRLAGGGFMHVPNIARNIEASFRAGDRRMAFLLSFGWDLPLWALASLMHGRFEVSGDEVTVMPADDTETEVNEILAILGTEPTPQED